MARGKQSNQQSPLRDRRLIYSDKLRELCCAMCHRAAPHGGSPKKVPRIKSRVFLLTEFASKVTMSRRRIIFTPLHQLSDEPRSEVGRRILATAVLARSYQSFLFSHNSMREDIIFRSLGEVVVTNSFLQYESWSPVALLVLLYTSGIKAPASPNRTLVRFTVAK